MTPRNSELGATDVASAVVVAETGSDYDDAHRFADLAGISLSPPDAILATRFLIRVRDGTVTIEPRRGDLGGPITVSWLSPDVIRRIRGGRRQPLARAVGLHRRSGLTLFDATAGLGRDGFVLAALGARVTLCERSALMFALLDAAWSRALSDPWVRKQLGDRTLRLLHADAVEGLCATPDAFDVIYLDPMYPHRRKAALQKKEMRVLRALVGDDADAGDVMTLARERATSRVVVKRPPHAPPLADAVPDLTFKGKQARYDVYLRKR